MKKITLIIAALVVAFAAKADNMWVGGGIGVDVQGWFNGGGTTVTFRVAPEFGYNLNEKWAVAGEIEYNYNGAFNIVKIGPYARYTFLDSSRISLFGEGGLHYVYWGGANGVDIVLRPGIALKLNDEWSLTGKLDLLKYMHAGQSDMMGFQLTTGLTLGVVYNF